MSLPSSAALRARASPMPRAAPDSQSVRYCKFPNLVTFLNEYVPVTTVTLPLSDIKSNTLCLLYSSASTGIGSEAPDPLAMILLMLLMSVMVAVVVVMIKTSGKTCSLYISNKWHCLGVIYIVQNDYKCLLLILSGLRSSPLA